MYVCTYIHKDTNNLAYQKLLTTELFGPITDLIHSSIQLVTGTRPLSNRRVKESHSHV